MFHTSAAVELIRLEGYSQKSEDNLAMAESELDKQTVLVTDLTRKVDELQERADEATRLKDQLDEYAHYLKVLPHNTDPAIDIVMRQTGSRRLRMSWRSTRRNCKRLQICGNKSRYNIWKINVVYSVLNALLESREAERGPRRQERGA